MTVIPLLENLQAFTTSNLAPGSGEASILVKPYNLSISLRGLASPQLIGYPCSLQQVYQPYSEHTRQSGSQAVW